jgi:hypothetical protein
VSELTQNPGILPLCLHCLGIDFLAKFARIFTNWKDDGLTPGILDLGG